MSTPLKLHHGIAAALPLLLAAGLAPAEPMPPADYWRDSSGTIWRNSYGECWHNPALKPEMHIPECGGRAAEPAALAAGDADGDGVVDAEDRCPGTPKGARVDARGCPVDSDGDGVYDGLDACPGTPRGARVDARGCPADSDGDGVYDGLDACPGTPKGTPVDTRGCELPQTIELQGVNFQVNTATLTADSREVLDRMAAALRANPRLKAEVAGHTDNTGDPAYNNRLSQRRAEAVREYLISRGVAAENLTARGYGPQRPIASNATREGRARNRRVELLLVK